MRSGIALMKNQVEALRGYGVKVHMLSSEATYPERQEVRPALSLSYFGKDIADLSNLTYLR